MKKPLALQEFIALFPHCPLSMAHEQLPLLNATMRQYRINNKGRIAGYCATLAEESGEFRYRSELASGADYEFRRDLGNVHPGDGVAFKGHGRIQITGRHNHTLYAKYIKESGHVPFIDFSDPKLAHRLAEDPYALDSSGWFWAVLHDLNALADRGNFLATQVTVNGRNQRTHLPNHWQERNDYYQRALRILPNDVGFDDEPAAAGPAIDVAPAVTEPARAIAAPPTPAIDGVLDSGFLNGAIVSDGAKQAGKKVLARAAVRLARPVTLLFAALEAGNVFAWLGVIVLIIGLGVLVYVEREDLKRAGQWLLAKLKK